MPESRPWRDDLIAALASLGGSGHLNDIYQAVERIRAPLTKQWKGTVRCKLQQFSSDSGWWRKARTRNRADIFTSPRAGYWQLRPIHTETETVRLLEQQIAEHTQALHDLKQQLRRVEQRQRSLRVLFFTAPPSRPRRNQR